MITFSNIALLLGITTLVVLILCAKANKKIQRLEEEKRTSNLKLDSDKERTLDKARQKGEEILNEASRKAMEILSETDSFNEDSRSKLKAHFDNVFKAQSEEIDRIGEKLLSEYQQQLDQIKKQNINTAHNVSKDLEKDLLLESKKEIEEYKKAQLEKVDAQIYDILAIVAEKVFGPGIKMEKHEELVLEALEKAKKEITSPQP
jgi:vacuolar-type H+-ATPase subunit H